MGNLLVSLAIDAPRKDFVKDDKSGKEAKIFESLTE